MLKIRSKYAGGRYLRVAMSPTKRPHRDMSATCPAKRKTLLSR